MKIGIDLDEVVFPLTERFLPYYNKINGTNFKFEDIYTYYFYEVFKTSKEHDTKMIMQFMETEEYKNMPLIEGAYEGIHELSKKSNIYFITGRLIEKRKITDEIIEKHFAGCYNEICFTNFKAETGHTIPKYKICEQKGINLMIEDVKESAIEISKECNIPVIMPKYPWNKNFDITGTKISRVNGWKGIMNYFEEI